MNRNLNELIKQISLEANQSTKPVNFKIGEVVQISPLKVKINNVIYPEEFFILSENVTDRYVDIIIDTISGGAIGDGISPHFHSVNGGKSVMIKNSLLKGEQVILANVQGGQKYIIIDRVAK